MCIEGIKCKYCNSTRINKMSKQNNNQRYLYRDCKKTFTIGEDRRKRHSKEFKLEAILWYLENTGIRSISAKIIYIVFIIYSIK